MNYLNRITEIPSDVRLLIPKFGEITIVYEEILDGGSASDFVYPDIVDGGGAQSIYTQEITGGDAQSFKEGDFSSTHYITFRHTATRQYFSLPCKLIEDTNTEMLLEVRFLSMPYVGQYHIALLEKNNPEALYMGILELTNNREEFPSNEYNNGIIQKQ